MNSFIAMNNWNEIFNIFISSFWYRVVELNMSTSRIQRKVRSRVSNTTLPPPTLLHTAYSIKLKKFLASGQNKISKINNLNLFTYILCALSLYYHTKWSVTGIVRIILYMYSQSLFSALHVKCWGKFVI